MIVVVDALIIVAVVLNHISNTSIIAVIANILGSIRVHCLWRSCGERAHTRVLENRSLIY